MKWMKRNDVVTYFTTARGAKGIFGAVVLCLCVPIVGLIFIAKLYLCTALLLCLSWRTCSEPGDDSAGLAILKPDRVVIYRSVGKIKELEHALWGRDLSGEVGLGHTRWATHGRPTEENAHPHSDCTGDVVVVHNGIIENYLALKEKLQQEGHHFKSETDTEVVAHLIEKQLQETADLEIAVRRALSNVVGAYALGILWRGDPHRLVAARNGSPLVVGLGDGEFFIASDVPAILSHTRNVLFLDDEEVVTLSPDGVSVTTLSRGAGAASRFRRSSGLRSWRRRAGTSTSC